VIQAKIRGYLVNRELGLFNGLFSSVIGINLGVGAVPSSERYTSPVLLAYVIYGFVLWHGLYFLNDLFDMSEDSRHPDKRLRPLASGILTRMDGYAIVGTHLLAAMLLAILVSWPLFWLSLMTIVQHVLYCAPPFRLKRYIFLGTLFAGPLGWALRIAVGWTLFKPLSAIPLGLCAFGMAFTYPLYLQRRITHQTEACTTTEKPSARLITGSQLALLVIAGVLAIYVSIQGPLTGSHLAVLALLGLAFAAIPVSLRRMRSKHQEALAKLVATVLSFVYLAVGP